MPLQSDIRFVRSLTDVPNGIALTVDNPIAYAVPGLPPVGTKLRGENDTPLPDAPCRLTWNPHTHAFEGRPLDAPIGAWETAREQGNWAAYADGDAPAVMVGISR